MSEFTYLFRGKKMSGSPEEMQEHFEKWAAWFKELAAKGHMRDPGHPLEATGKVVSGHFQGDEANSRPVKGLCSRKRHPHSSSHRLASSTLYTSPPPGVRKNSPAISAAKGGLVWVGSVQKSTSSRRAPSVTRSRVRRSSSRQRSGCRLCRMLAMITASWSSGIEPGKKVTLNDLNACRQRAASYAATGNCSNRG
jgi:hypothetical protein